MQLPRLVLPRVALLGEASVAYTISRNPARGQRRAAIALCMQPSVAEAVRLHRQVDKGLIIVTLVFHRRQICDAARRIFKRTAEG
jgi:hypothetical protein